MYLPRLKLELSGPPGDQAAAWTKETTVEEDTNRSMVKRDLMTVAESNYKNPWCETI